MKTQLLLYQEQTSTCCNIIVTHLTLSTQKVTPIMFVIPIAHSGFLAKFALTLLLLQTITTSTIFGLVCIVDVPTQYYYIGNEWHATWERTEEKPSHKRVKCCSISPDTIISSPPSLLSPGNQPCTSMTSAELSHFTSSISYKGAFPSTPSCHSASFNV